MRDGDAYQADTLMYWSLGTPYHFVFDIDVTARRYSVAAAARGTSAWTQLATDYAFRTEQQGVTSLGAQGQFVDGSAGWMVSDQLLIAY